MLTDDDAEMRRKIGAALKAQLASTYGSDFLSPEACRRKAAELKAAYGSGGGGGSSEDSRGGSAGSTKQADYRGYGDRPPELVNSRTRFGARDRQVPKYQSGVLPQDAVTNGQLVAARQHQHQQQGHQTTYKSEISGPGERRLPQQQQHQEQQQAGSAVDHRSQPLRRLRPQWEGPVGPSANQG